MKFLITGSVGFVGRHLCRVLLERGDQVVGIGLRSDQDVISHQAFQYISADTTRKGAWQEALADADAVINLAGKTIFKRWSKAYKKDIYDSRILTTRNLVEALPERAGLPVLSTSAVGYYGNRGEEILTEDASCGDDFLAQVGIDWEAEALKAEEKGARVVLPRFGIVLGKNGGAMAKMVLAFRAFVGGPLGNGQQWFPWIHMEDLVSAILFSLENEAVRGPVNFCAPNPVRNLKLAKTLGKVLGRPSFMPAPAFMIRLVMGELGSVLLSSQRATPKKLLQAGFTFKYPDLDGALHNLLTDQ